MGKRPFKLILIISFCLFSCCGYAKDLELVLYRSFLQKLMNGVFPVRIEKSYKPQVSLGQIGNLLAFDYTLSLRDPVLVIHGKYIQVNADIDLLSPLGKHTFPGRCRFVPVFNKSKNLIEFKVTEGTVRVKIDTDSVVLDLGTVDISPFISNIKLPLEYGKITVSGRQLRPQCEDVGFRLYKDRVVVTGDIEIAGR